MTCYFVTLFIITYIKFVFSTDLIYEFKEAKVPTHRTIYVRAGTQTRFSCFVIHPTDKNYGKLAVLLKNANWRGPRGIIMMPGLVDSNRIHIDVMKTLRIFKASLKDTGQFKCVITRKGQKIVEHTVEVLVYRVPEVALETPFVFKVIGNCKHSLHKLAPMAEQVHNHLCGSHEDPMKSFHETCQYNMSMVCQPYRTYRSIMRQENKHLKEHLNESITTVINKTHHAPPHPIQFLMGLDGVVDGIGTTRSIDETKEVYIDEYDGVSESIYSTTSEVNKKEKKLNPDSFNKINKKMYIKRNIKERKIAFTKVYEKDMLDKSNGTGTYAFTNTPKILDNYSYDLSNNSALSPATLNPMDYPEFTVSDTMQTTTQFLPDLVLDPKVEELKKMNDIFKEENKLNLAVLYLLKIPDPHFSTPDCDNACLLKLKIYHISWHSDTIIKLIQFIQSASSLPSGVNLMPETVFKGRLALYCKPGFFIKGNYCLPCVPGSFNDDKYKSYCKPCPVNTFQELYGGKVCQHCPEGMRTKTQIGSFKAIDCYYVGKEQIYVQKLFTIIIKSLAMFFGMSACIYAFIAFVQYVKESTESNATLTTKFKKLESHFKRTVERDKESILAENNSNQNNGKTRKSLPGFRPHDSRNFTLNLIKNGNVHSLINKLRYKAAHDY